MKNVLYTLLIKIKRKDAKKVARARRPGYLLCVFAFNFINNVYKNSSLRKTAILVE